MPLVHSFLPRSLSAHGRVLAPIMLLLLLQGAAWAASTNQPTTNCSLPRPQDEVWLVSCRAVTCWPANQPADQLQYWRYDRSKSWVQSSLKEFLAGGDSNVITTIHAHGNRISHQEAFESCWTAYSALARGADERPIRFVTWSWPSEEYRGPVEDARIKAARTGPAGYQLAQFIDQLDPQAPVGLWGHSFGARVITSALHLLGGGSLDGYKLAKREHPDRQLMDVVLLVAALDNDWLLPGHYHGQATSQVATLLLVNNSCDFLLEHYHRLYGRRCSQEALGLLGAPGWGASSGDVTKVSQIDACCYVGRRHEFVGYVCSPELMARIRPNLLFVSTDKPTAAPQTASVEDNGPASAEDSQSPLVEDNRSVAVHENEPAVAGN